jgi:anti-sigma factor ChrR (cupin superfamily)
MVQGTLLIGDIAKLEQAVSHQPSARRAMSCQSVVQFTASPLIWFS